MAITLKRYHWERTLLFLEFEKPLNSENAALVIKGARYIPDQDKEPTPYDLVLDNTSIVAPNVMRVRFFAGNKGNPVFPGEYQLFVRQGQTCESFASERSGSFTDVPILADETLVNPLPPDYKRSDSLLYLHVDNMYQVLPKSLDGMLHVAIKAKMFPRKFGFDARGELKLALRIFRRSVVNSLSVACFNLFRKCMPYKKDKILFTSDSRTELTGNMEPLYARMQERGILRDHKVVFSFKPKKSKEKNRGIISYISLAYHLATSGSIFCDDFQPYLYHVVYPKQTRLVQLWHACGAFKTVGFGRIGTVDAVETFTNDHRTYTDVVVASDRDVPIYAESFGLSDVRVKPWGIPRHDWLLNAQWQQNAKDHFAQCFPEAAGKRVIVFAPTFRGRGQKSAYYEFGRIDFQRLAEFCRQENCFFIFKMHPFVTQKPPLPPDSSDVFVDGSSFREINEILPSTDVLITDYSSVVYEAALLSIPTIYFAYDLKEYISERNFYEPFEEFVSGKIVQTFDGLLQTLQANDFDLERLKVFREKNFKYLDGKACDRIIDNVLLGKESHSKDKR